MEKYKWTVVPRGRRQGQLKMYKKSSCTSNIPLSRISPFQAWIPLPKCRSSKRSHKVLGRWPPSIIYGSEQYYEFTITFGAGCRWLWETPAFLCCARLSDLGLADVVLGGEGLSGESLSFLFIFIIIINVALVVVIHLLTGDRTPRLRQQGRIFRPQDQKGHRQSWQPSNCRFEAHLFCTRCSSLPPSPRWRLKKQIQKFIREDEVRRRPTRWSLCEGSYCHC